MGGNRSLDDFLDVGGTDEDEDGIEHGGGSTGDGSDDDANDVGDGSGASTDAGDEAATDETTAEERAVDDADAAGDTDAADAMDVVAETQGSDRTVTAGPDVLDATTDTDADTDAPDASAAVDVDPPRTTCRWSPAGDDCPACGASVQRRWREDDRFVCADCKEW